MDRRDWIRLAGAAVGGVASSALGAEWLQNHHVTKMGADRPLTPKRDRKRFYNTFKPFAGVSKASGTKNVFLFHNLQKQLGEIVPHNQSTITDENGYTLIEGEGDCVGQAAAMIADTLAATNIHDLGRSEQFVAKASVEMLYAGSRYEIGKDGYPEQNPNQKNWIKGRAGSHGEWVARFMKEYGVLHRMQYADNSNSIDLRGYDPNRSRKYRDAGVPDWLERFAKEHPVAEITNVQSGQEALDAICARQPVLMCSSYAFKDTRDDQGFADPYLGMGRQGGFFGGQWGRIVQWWHAMALTGAILEGGRIGGIIQNSHGAWNTGPRPYGMPEGSFAVDLEILDRMVKDWFDCYAISAYKGHEARRMRHKLYF